MATAVQLRYDITRASMPEDMRRRLRLLAGTHITRDGRLLIQASRHRSQAQNRADARARLLAMLRKAATRPGPRVPTGPSRASREHRLEAKRRRGLLQTLTSRYRVAGQTLFRLFPGMGPIHPSIGALG